MIWYPPLNWNLDVMSSRQCLKVEDDDSVNSKHSMSDWDVLIPSPRSPMELILHRWILSKDEHGRENYVDDGSVFQEW